MSLISENSDQIPEEYLPMIIHYLKKYDNTNVDLSKPHLNPYFATNYPIIVLVYSLLIISSVLANLAMIFHVVKRRLYKDTTCAFLINIAIASTVHVTFVLPITLAVMLMQNWIFGRLICFCLPIFQDLPIHISMLTYLMIAGDRYRYLSDPIKSRIPAFVCSLGALFFAICIVLPYPIYATYLDFQNFSEAQDNQTSIRGLQMCIFNLADDIQEYMRGLFIGTYIAPLTITAYFNVKSGQELQNQEIPFPVAVYEARTNHSAKYSRQGSSVSNDVMSSIRVKQENESSGTSGTVAISNLSTSCDLEDSDLDIHKEKRTQKYIVLMTTAFAICLCPLMILRLIKPSIEETYANADHINMTYVTLVWVAFLPEFITPCLYASWQMNM
ncbi:prolactin-releasing peptide receptor isoform X2 [Phymastichus coffea]|uniref:prolactin-releasing peptide receptor isoform X2 n=1 Tax=Phymastichus coffea TaxID=108790 RepID=UPI00273AEBB2|nr:prolactin-releasing peptide receptor isoform X2 [Phymastichus coffea]